MHQSGGCIAAFYPGVNVSLHTFMVTDFYLFTYLFTILFIYYCWWIEQRIFNTDQFLYEENTFL